MKRAKPALKAKPHIGAATNPCQANPDANSLPLSEICPCGEEPPEGRRRPLEATKTAGNTKALKGTSETKVPFRAWGPSRWNRASRR